MPSQYSFYFFSLLINLLGESFTKKNSVRFIIKNQRAFKEKYIRKSGINKLNYVEYNLFF